MLPSVEPPQPEPSALSSLSLADPGLAAALARHADGDGLEEAAAVLLVVDPRLRDLLLPTEPAGPFPDRRGEDVRVDLIEANVRLEDTMLVGTVHGVGAADNGVWLELDTRGGPLADLLLGFGRGWSREATIDGGAPSPMLAREVMPVVGADRVSFSVDLAGSARFDPTHAGRVTAFIKSFDGSIADVGPGGFLGPPPGDALALFAGFVAAGPLPDANLAVAVAIGFGTLRGQVEDPVVPTVDADALAWLRYGEGLDTWLAERGATWRLGTQDALGKLVWGWPAAQSLAYGQFALAKQAEPLTHDAWRFVVPDVADLAALAELAPRLAQPGATADAVDAWLWKAMDYRTNDDLMRALCRDGALARDTCKAWNAERIRSASLGKVGAVDVAPSEGVSVALQRRLLRERGRFVGDCAVATGMAVWTLQALGIPAIGMGWAGTDTSTPTHDVPLWLDGETFRATQRGPGRDWAAESAFVYVTLPGVHPVNAFGLAREPNGWSRGGAVVGGWTRFSEVRRILAEGLPASIVGGWIDVQAAGGWPTW
ncbi:MAG: hypothetical protein EXR71_21175 [Myxococcales bacterium]|nr:hypothetical protein [Myxococcales bacterium]